ncbi:MULTISPECIES: ROK family protein [Cohnella]|uniref:ROK family protein n=1 Tax=Cohnella TaxID=329857 RepID=UPI0009BB166E|nr:MULTISPECIES: ROK family protein [Cohnella]MBN2984932.1 ROK family protein [Cohnella algarum]
MTQNSVFAGVDIGGTKVMMVLAAEDGKIIAEKKFPTDASMDPDRFFARIIGELEAAAAENGLPKMAIEGIGLGFPGVINDDEGILRNAPAFPWNAPNIKESIRKYFQGELYLDNDVNVAALGEHWLGAAAGVDDFLMVTVGTGIGGAVFLNGDIYRGATHAAGELGYFIIKAPDSGADSAERAQERPFEFGQFENVASGTAIGRRAQEHLTGNDKPSLIREMAGFDLEAINARHVLDAAGQGDSEALKILDKPLTYMAIGLANAVSLLNPALVVMGGGVAEAGEVYLEAICEKMKHFTPIPAAVVSAKLGNRAGALGALAGVLEKCRKHVMKKSMQEVHS